MSATNPESIDEIGRLSDYIVDDVIPILEEGSFIPRYEPKQRDKYYKRREMTSDEKVHRRREQNRLASKRARLKKFHQKKFLRRVLDELTRKQTTLVKQLELFGVNPNMYIDGVLSPSMEPSAKTVSGMNDQAKKLCQRNEKLRELLSAVSASKPPSTAPPIETEPTMSLPKLLPMLTAREPTTTPTTTTSTSNESPTEQMSLETFVPPHKDTPLKPWQPPPYQQFPSMPAPSDCYTCAVTMGYGCAHCGHGARPSSYPVYPQGGNMGASNAFGGGYPSYSMPYFPQQVNPGMGCCSGWQQPQPAQQDVSNFAPGGFMGLSDAYMNSEDFQMDFSSVPVSQQFTFAPPHGY